MALTDPGYLGRSNIWIITGTYELNWFLTTYQTSVRNVTEAMKLLFRETFHYEMTANLVKGGFWVLTVQGRTILVISTWSFYLDREFLVQ